ncbi:LPS export ABC transporter periplasmic protein LptC [Mucilaginibacter segetis]|uniref:LPS export ABC transporter periplasmic protein LptC n=1 Tax=Mucilaginibacter segetis TaxID=2793071 RepID=A0A934ULL7_9SPHI|nr:LPS export ABC transporter periplasmic protein LptC [Mucilaginibacter segetis]MBK0378006.1 LPS export ABC transporter periplasmic protein LptC [Mucilaginibacter segetis]
MQCQIKFLKTYGFAVTIGLFALTACENDINKVKEIAAADATKPIERTTGVEVIYSDSAKVKAKLTTPLMINYKVEKNPYMIMPKGVKVIFYNGDLKIEGNIVADSAIQYENKKLIEFHKNVVATNTEGTVYKSDELIWDQTKKQIFSNKPVEMTRVGGDIMRGSSFTSDEGLHHPKFQNTTGVLHVNDDLTQ